MSVWLYMPQYPWVSLNILENLWRNCPVLTIPGIWICLVMLHIWQVFEDASGSKCRVFQIALKGRGDKNFRGNFSRWSGEGWEDKQILASGGDIPPIPQVEKTLKYANVFARVMQRICLNMAQYASAMPEYGSICLNVSEYCWMSLNMPENA